MPDIRNLADLDNELILEMAQDRGLLDGWTRWVSVKERLPQSKISTLAAIADGILYKIAFYCGTPREGWWATHRDNRLCNVTHWMEIPPVPQEEQ